MVTRDKIIGMFLGVGVGDGLGRPLEGMTHEEVSSTFGRITTYIVPDGWPAGRKIGGSDDSQLTLAVAEGLLASGGKTDMNSQVQAHINAFNESTQGWGRTTHQAVRKLTLGLPWRVAGVRGSSSNGAIMKLAPTALLLVECVPGSEEFIRDLISMTHQSSMAVSAGFAHATGLAYCLQVDPCKFDPAEFVQVVVNASEIGRNYFTETLTEDDLTERLVLCRDYTDWPPGRCVAEMQNGGNYVYDALPYSLMFFLRQPKSIQSLFEVVSAGGDTDTNGSVVGSLLGALNGTAVFPAHLVHELDAADRLVDTADRLTDSVSDDVSRLRRPVLAANAGQARGRSSGHPAQ